MVEQNAGRQREHTKKKHGKRIKAWEKRQRVALEQVYCLKRKKVLKKCSKISLPRWPCQVYHAKVQSSIDSEVLFKTRNVLFIGTRQYKPHLENSCCFSGLSVKRGTDVEAISYGNCIEDIKFYVQKYSSGRRSHWALH